MAARKHRLWCFTYNNPQPEWRHSVEEHWRDRFTYLGIGEEVSPSTGTPHLQGCFRCSQPIRHAAAKVRICQSLGADSVHLEAAAGTFAQCRDYCSKDGSFHEWGEQPKQGKRTDLADASKLVIDNMGNVDAVIREFPAEFVKYHRGLIALGQRLQPRRDFKTKIIWCWGPTGTGKSRFCHEQAPEAYWKPSNNKWWDGYANEDAVIIDDFRPCKEVPLSYILRLFDRYPLSVESKGGTLVFNSKVIYVTAPKRPEDLYHDLPFEIADEQINQLLRRIEEIHHFDQLANVDNT